MGLIRELFDEIISLPNQQKNEFIEDNVIASTSYVGYALINLFFQIIDCIIVPGITYLCLTNKLNVGFFNWAIIIIGGFASVFSLFQVVYYFFFPTDKYIHPIKGRLLGETAIGVFIGSIFKIPLYSRIK
jgi:hypothetical protein